MKLHPPGWRSSHSWYEPLLFKMSSSPKWTQRPPEGVDNLAISSGSVEAGKRTRDCKTGRCRSLGQRSDLVRRRPGYTFPARGRSRLFGNQMVNRSRLSCWDRLDERLPVYFSDLWGGLVCCTGGHRLISNTVKNRCIDEHSYSCQHYETSNCHRGPHTYGGESNGDPGGVEEGGLSLRVGSKPGGLYCLAR